MKYFLFSVFIILFIGLVVTYINISNFNIGNNIINKKDIKSSEKQINILKLLSTNNKNYNIFPARELYVKINLNSTMKFTILYQAIFNNLNKYTVFGVEQILRLNNIRYSIIKSKKDFKLFINFDKKLQAKKIIDLFKNYKFYVKLKKIKIEKGMK
jgi:Fe2+ or Zn2+ uptake regulation protein